MTGCIRFHPLRKFIKHSILLIVLTGVGGCTLSPPIQNDPIPQRDQIISLKVAGPEPVLRRFAIGAIDRLQPEVGDSLWGRVDPDSLFYALRGVRQFRGNSTHTFYGTGEIPAAEPEIIWAFQTGQNFSRSLTTPWQGLGWTGQPAVSVEAEGVFVYIAALDGHLYKLDFETGVLVCKTEENVNIIKSSPAVTDDYVIFGSWDNAVYIFDRRTFRVLHREEAIYTPSASYDFDSSPVIDGQWLYIGGEDGYVRKISLVPPFRRAWIYPRSIPRSPFTYGQSKKPYVGIESTVAIAGDRLIVGTGRGEVLILNKHTGDSLAVFETGDDTDSTPVVDLADSSFYIGVEKDFQDAVGGLYKISLMGQQQWFFPVGRQGVFSTAAIDSVRVVITGDDGYLYALSKQDGQLLWKTRLLDGSWSSPILIKNRIVTADYAGYLYGIDAHNGAILWKKKLGNYIVASPVLWKSTILIGTRDGYILALREKGSE